MFLASYGVVFTSSVAISAVAAAADNAAKQLPCTTLISYALSNKHTLAFLEAP